MGCWFTKEDLPTPAPVLPSKSSRRSSRDDGFSNLMKPLRNGKKTTPTFFFFISFVFLGNLDRSRMKLPYGIEKVYVAIYDYDARTDEDLTFRVGDLLIILDDRSNVKRQIETTRTFCFCFCFFQSNGLVVSQRL